MVGSTQEPRGGGCNPESMRRALVCGGAPLTRCWHTLQTLFCLTVWFTASIFIAFSSKHLLSNVHFHYPFFLAFCTNSGVGIISFFVTRVPALRQPSIPRRTFLRNVVPLAAATTLDIGFSNWSLMFLAVSMHTILKGSAPLFVLICGLLLRVESPSWRTPFAIVLIVGGLSLVVCDRLTLPDRPLGLLLGIVSVSFTGLRWALTQLLMRGNSSAASASSGTARGTSSRQLGPSASDEPAPPPAPPPPDPPAGPPPRKTTHPLNTMLHTMPVIAVLAFVCVLLLEREVFVTLSAFAADGTLPSFLAYILVLWLLVFALVLAEFQLVILTSSLTVSVFGVIKEIVTVLAAVIVGDHLSALNVAGIALCLLGNLAYFTRRSVDAPSSAPTDKEAPSVGLANADGARSVDAIELTIAHREAGSDASEVAAQISPRERDDARLHSPT